MATLQIRLDDSLQTRAREVATGMGLDLSTAVRIFLTQMVTENGLPFQPHTDTFYSPANQAALRRSLAQMNEGGIVTKSLEELESMAE
ncbi:MAG: type II toxin-antitoxin system RelB/DinJ family antitoxin [Deltaproteobacteria bacterium]|jgi:DNA-damage-inducible protein J|nr:type II toxin-antitoxin system RelB/DinJ family antitoxin [Deltaproteobacteria bacterium]